MNTFRHGLLKERAEKIRPDLDRAREVIEKAEAKHRDLTPEEKAATEPVLKEAKDIAAGFRALREQDATKEAINAEFADVMGPLDSTPGGGSPKEGQRLSFKSMGGPAATKIRANGPDGAKALATSSTVISEQTFVPDPIALGKPATSLRLSASS